MTMIWATDLWFPGRQPDTIGRIPSSKGRARWEGADLLRYVLWFDAGRTPDHAMPELTPRTALHVNACDTHNGQRGMLPGGPQPTFPGGQP